MRVLQVSAWSERGRRRVTSLLIVALLATQIASLAPSFPYYLSFYNPLFGGPAAPRG